MCSGQRENTIEKDEQSLRDCNKRSNTSVITFIKERIKRAESKNTQQKNCQLLRDKKLQIEKADLKSKRI